MTAEALLSRLSRVRKVGPGRWVACCPCHESRSRSSLAITEAPDGRVLVHDHGGCDVADVLADVGLTFDDLFPPKLDVNEADAVIGRHGSRMRQPYWSAQLIDAIAGEALLVAVVASDLAKGTAITDDRRARLWAAAGRLSSIAGWTNGR